MVQPSSAVDGSRHNLAGSPFTKDSHVLHSPVSHPRCGRGCLARYRTAHSAETSDHVANVWATPSISNATVASCGFTSPP